MATAAPKPPLLCIPATLPGHDGHDTRSERKQGGEVAAVQREIIDLFGRNHCAQVGVALRPAVRPSPQRSPPGSAFQPSG